MPGRKGHSDVALELSAAAGNIGAGKLCPFTCLLKPLPADFTRTDRSTGQTPIYFAAFLQRSTPMCGGIPK